MTRRLISKTELCLEGYSENVSLPEHGPRMSIVSKRSNRLSIKHSVSRTEPVAETDGVVALLVALHTLG